MKPKYYYMMVTYDKYELPLCVAESVNELAEMTGTKPNTINVALRRASITEKKPHARKKKYKYVKVEIPDEPDGRTPEEPEAAGEGHPCKQSGGDG